MLPQRQGRGVARPRNTVEGWTASRGEWRLASKHGTGRQDPLLRDANLKALYGISLVQYEGLLRRQDGVCAICARPPGGKR
jgi:hypothetical protein